MRIAVIEGDGIGPEVTRSAIEVLKMAASKYGLNIDIAYVEAGDNAVRKYGGEHYQVGTGQ